MKMVQKGAATVLGIVYSVKNGPQKGVDRGALHYLIARFITQKLPPIIKHTTGGSTNTK